MELELKTVRVQLEMLRGKMGGEGEKQQQMENLLEERDSTMKKETEGKLRKLEEEYKSKLSIRKQSELQKDYLVINLKHALAAELNMNKQHRENIQEFRNEELLNKTLGRSFGSFCGITNI
ncbi:hypothetical protein ScalyP_jg12075 [Parmales sp. scaly parma]|nr:hypothetical protein ScalyP_jg12075 [Parmales sp. scaly parma]